MAGLQLGKEYFFLEQKRKLMHGIRYSLTSSKGSLTLSPPQRQQLLTPPTLYSSIYGTI